MKEVTYEDWQKNPIPRMMWVWDSDVENKIQAKVISIVKPTVYYPVLSIMSGDIGYDTFCHCAEIEKQRRMTNKELARWLREKSTREWKYMNDNHIHSYHDYEERYVDEEVHEDVLIREDDGEWREPNIVEE